MPITWHNGWREVSDEKHRVYIEGELGWELDHVQEEDFVTVS